MDFIKSHSNYVLKKKHQTISDGTIWERDITTIGGVNQFSPGQIPIYKSNNFIITVRNDGKIANQYNQTKWKENESGDTWTLETISGMTSEFEDQNDVKIILKQDYYDFCDFAYYGSLTEMCRASINDVLKRFPSEMYVTEECAYYTTGITVDFERVDDRVVLGDPKEKDDCQKIYIVDAENKTSTYVCRREQEIINDCKDITDDRYVSNPFGIDAHSIKKPKDGKELKFFAENGYKNYMIIKGDVDGSDDDKITEWKTRNFIKVIKNEEALDNLYGGCAFYYHYLKPEILKFYFEQPDNEVWWMENDNNKITEKSRYKDTEYSTPQDKGSQGYDDLVDSFLTGDIKEEYEKYRTKWRIERIETITDADNCVCEKYSVIEEPQYESEEIANTHLPTTPWEDNVRYVARIGACCADIDCYITSPCKGYKAASLTATSKNNEIVIGAWVGDNNEIVYLAKEEYKDIHVRPIEKFIVQFYNESDNFERIIVNMKTTPRYKAIFSVIKENERGYYRELETFIFPTSYGGYNLDASSFSFTEYTNRFAEIGAYYDELFTDNLYRAMTHEAIKNFDWTYTREFYYGDETEYVHGGEKIQKALRIFAREFDEIMAYINNIKNLNRVTYDERSNVPDYFLIDQVENKGWDVCLVYPYDLEEYYINDDGEKVYINSNSYDEDQQLDNEENGKKFTRQFSQNTKKEVRPYRSELLDYPEGYFITCSDKGDTPCWYSGDKKSCYKKEGEESVQYKYLSAENSGNTYYDDDSRTLINRIKSFSDERSYTYMDANNEFMRRMAINSPYIWRHKGTIEGLEMILGMFGLKSKRWVEKMPEYRKWKWDGSECKDYEYDYEINEYSSFTNRIKEKWDAVHQMYRIDWINSTKTIVYDNRLKSNYTKYGANNNYTSYQGLPVLYRDEYIQYVWDSNCKRIKLYKDKECTDAYKCDDKIDSTKVYKKIRNKPYIKISPLKYDEEQDVTDNKNNDAFKRIDENNAPVIIRYLYPNFDKNDELDGNPYFQMKGGWMSKTVQNGVNKDGDETNRYNFQYDVDDNVAYTCYVTRGSDEDDEVKDNHFLYKETVRNIKRVDTIADLIATPINTVKDGTIFYVTNVESGIAIVDNEVFYIKYEYNSEDNDKPYRYVSLIKENDYIKVGDEKFFTYTIIVYDKEGNEALYDLTDKEDGYEVKAYILYEDENPQFICKADYDGIYTIDSFMILDDKVTSATTNYFIIDDSFYSNRLATEEVRNGWRRLEETDQEYIMVNTIINYYEGNNPHNGNMDYDSGHNYFTHFKRLFKTPIDNELFDERCYESFYYDLDNEINEYGFRNLIEDNEMIKQYFPFISGLTESKIHYFGSYYKSAYDTSDKCARKSASALTKCKNVRFYGEDTNKIHMLEAMYQKSQSSAITVYGYILNDKVDRSKRVLKGMIGGTPYSASNMVDIDEDEVDEVTNQILNNKRLTIKFYLHNCWHSNQGQCELKYLDSIVMNYLTQMIPSTTIFDVQYIGCCDEEQESKQRIRWVYYDEGCHDDNWTEKIKEQVSEDGGQNWTDTGNEEWGKVITFNDPRCSEVPDPDPDDPPIDEQRIMSAATIECNGADLQEKLVEMVSTDGGVTWEEVDGGKIEWGEVIKENGCCEYSAKTIPNAETVTFTIEFQDADTITKEKGVDENGYAVLSIKEDLSGYDGSPISVTAIPNKEGYYYETIKEINCFGEGISNGTESPCTFNVETDADKVKFMNQEREVLTTVTVTNGVATYQISGYESLFAKGVKTGFEYEEVQVDCNGSATTMATRINIAIKLSINTIGDNVYMNHVGLAQDGIQLIHKSDNASKNVILFSDELDFIDAPCKSEYSNIWKTSIEETITLSGELQDKLSEYKAISVTMGIMIFKSKKNPNCTSNCECASTAPVLTCLDTSESSNTCSFMNVSGYSNREFIRGGGVFEFNMDDGIKLGDINIYLYAE